MNADAGDYILPVDKAVGPTSHDVVAVARRALHTKRVGHTGTLDPFASGLLLLCVGQATRLAEYLTGLDKRYVACARLGTSTDTLDSEGTVVSTSDGWRSLGDADIVKALRALTGSILQVPPQYSAKKVDGEAMHHRARRGEHVDLAPVPVDVFGIEVDAIRLPEVRFTVHCGSGTYVRGLARDMGLSLGVGAHLTELRRTSVGAFSVDDAVQLDELADADVISARRVEPVRAIQHFDALDVDRATASRLRNGQRVRVAEAQDPEPLTAPPASAREYDPRSLVAVSNGDDLLAIAELDDGLLRPRKVFPS